MHHVACSCSAVTAPTISIAYSNNGILAVLINGSIINSPAARIVPDVHCSAAGTSTGVKNSAVIAGTKTVG